MNKHLIKICGLTDPEMAAAAVEAGADMIGIMCYQQSKRYVDLAAAIAIAQAVKAVDGEPVLVFVDQDAHSIMTYCQATGVYTVQLHGDIARASHQQLAKFIRRIYVVPVQDNGQLVDKNPPGLAELDSTHDWLLFDRVTGGSGQNFNWENFYNPYNQFPFLLSGGLTIDNVAYAMACCRPQGVDVSSGVESAPGQKKFALIKQFIKTVRTEDEKYSQ